MSTPVQYTSKDAYVIITITNGKANAISHEVIDALNIGIQSSRTRKESCYFNGTTWYFFLLDMTLKSMTASPEAALELVTKGSMLSLRMLSFPFPVIIACGGHAIAKGAFLLLSADYRIGTEGDFKIGLNEVMIGMTMHHAGIEIAKARLAPIYFERSISNSEIYTPANAVTAGFLDRIVPEDHLMPTAIKIAEMFSNLNKKAHAETKLKVRKNYLNTLQQAIEQDRIEGLNPPIK